MDFEIEEQSSEKIVKFKYFFEFFINQGNYLKRKT